MNKKVAIIAHGLRGGGGISVGANTISTLKDVRPQHQYLLVMPDMPEYRQLSAPPRSEKIFYSHRSYLGRFYFDKVTLPRLVREFEPDLLLCLGNVGLKMNVPCQAVLLHKPQLVYPRKHKPGETLMKRGLNMIINWQLSRSMRYVDIVFCQTKVIGQRFQERFSYKGRIGLMPNAVSKSLMADDAESACPLDRKDGHFYLFALTRYYPHKNLESIVKCFATFRDELANVVCFLTIDPAQHSGAKTLLRDISRKGLSEQIINVGPLEQKELPGYYGFADGLLQPTLIESFSGAYFEAMSFGCPILTSDLDFAHAVCGDAAVYFDPWSIDSMKDAILGLAKDAKSREALVERGRRHVEQTAIPWNRIVDEAFQDMEGALVPPNTRA